MLRIPFVLLGDALLPVDVPLLQVRPDVGYLRPAVVDVAACLRGVVAVRTAVSRSVGSGRPRLARSMAL